MHASPHACSQSDDTCPVCADAQTGTLQTRVQFNISEPGDIQPSVRRCPAKLLWNKISKFNIQLCFRPAHAFLQRILLALLAKAATCVHAGFLNCPRRGALLYTAGQNRQPCPRWRQPDGGARRRASLRGTPGQRRRHPPSSRWKIGFLMSDWLGVRTSGCRPCSRSASSKTRVSAGYPWF